MLLALDNVKNPNTPAVTRERDQAIGRTARIDGISEGNFSLCNFVYNTPKACQLFRIDLEGNKRLSPG
jgi:hypothetical protein